MYISGYVNRTGFRWDINCLCTNIFIFTFTITLLCLDPLHVSGVKRPSSGGTTLADFGVSYVHCSFWLVAGCGKTDTRSTKRQIFILIYDGLMMTPLMG
jgi:hypothetical protein